MMPSIKGEGQAGVSDPPKAVETCPPTNPLTELLAASPEGQASKPNPQGWPSCVRLNRQG